jgi:hypothetical protein
MNGATLPSDEESVADRKRQEKSVLAKEAGVSHATMGRALSLVPAL